MASKDLASGANPTTTFPNTHLAHLAHDQGRERQGSATQETTWAAPEASVHTPIAQLREAVENEDWVRVYEEGRTKMQANAKWSASAERCSALQCLCTMNKATRILEIGSFCGCAALAMAEAIPKDGEVVALELEPYFVEFGQRFKSMSHAGSKITVKVGPAGESLKELVEQAKSGASQPFDLVVIDGDKASMQQYFELVRSPGMVTDAAMLCLDVTPFKGQPPTRYVKFGAVEKWESQSGEEEIAALQRAVNAAPDFVSHQFGGMLVVQRRPPE